MNFKIWLEEDEVLPENDDTVVAAVLNAIPGYAGSEEDKFWLRKRVMDYFQHSSDIRKKLLQDMAIKQQLKGRNAVEFIKTFRSPKGPTFQEFINWLQQDVNLA